MLSNIINKLIILLYKVRLYKSYNNPLIKESYSKSIYIELYKQTINEITNSEIINFEKFNNFKIDINWLNDLALHTQITKKKSKLSFNHGRILYTALRSYLKNNFHDETINIIETGTARGFSALCMAKALQDHGKDGRIFTYDLIPHLTPIFWNCIDDISGKKTRQKLLENWKNIVDKYIYFINGDTFIELQRLQLDRVHFAFLDGEHTFEKMIFEFETICKKQIKNDVIVIDDYDHLKFNEIVNATNLMAKKHNYSINLIQSFEGRYEAILTKN